MSKTYKTPLYKSKKIDEKLGVEGKLIGLEDMLPSVADKIKNAIHKDDMNFAKNYGIDNLENIFNFLNSKNLEIIHHGIFQSEEKEYEIDSDIYLYNQNIYWDELKFNQVFEQKTNPFSGFISHHYDPGLTYNKNNSKSIHRIFVFDVVAPASGQNGTVSLTPIPDEITELCSNGRYSLNITYTEIANPQIYTPTCRSELYGSSGKAVRTLGFAGITAYNCLATLNCSETPVALNAELIVFE